MRDKTCKTCAGAIYGESTKQKPAGNPLKQIQGFFIGVAVISHDSVDGFLQV